MTDDRVCTKCDQSKPANDFYRASPVNQRQGREYQSWCKECTKADRRARRESPSGREYGRAYRLRIGFGLTVEGYDALADSQGSVCAICEEPETATRGGVLRRLNVDHDHVTGKTRGLLCSRCNTAIGLLRDDPRIVNRAHEYLLLWLDE